MGRSPELVPQACVIRINSLLDITSGAFANVEPDQRVGASGGHIFIRIKKEVGATFWTLSLGAHLVMAAFTVSRQPSAVSRQPSAVRGMFACNSRLSKADDLNSALILPE
jgi:hypothetical protein